MSKPDSKSDEMKNALTRKTSGKGLTRSMDRRGSRSDMSPPVTRRAEFRDPSICDRCGAVYTAKTWRRGRRLSDELVDRATWVHCPGCAQAETGEYHGRVLLELPERAAVNADDVSRRIKNVENRAGFTQPERKILSSIWNGNELEVLTTSQKLAHRIARELAKAFGGKPRFSWDDQDGTLLARLKVNAIRTKRAGK
jgi:hypothetical protein